MQFDKSATADASLASSDANGFPAVPPSREPLFNVPAVVVGLLAVLVAIQGLSELVSSETEVRIVAKLAFVPIRLTALFDPAGVAQHLSVWSDSTAPEDASRAGLARFFLRQGAAPGAPTLLTYALLHGGWAHVGLNSVWLLAFGTPLARRIRALRFLELMGVCAVVGALTHWALFPFGAEPLVGASAAVSGCMGAALRFAFHSERGASPPDAAVPILPLMAVFRERRAVSFLVAWFASNALFGIGSISFGLSDQPVAWQAHVGGFLAGLLLFRWFDPAPAPPNTTGSGTG